MALFDTYSKQRKRALNVPDVFLYEPIPVKLRNQVILALEGVLGPYNQGMLASSRREWKMIEDAVRIELGVINIPVPSHFSYSSDAQVILQRHVALCSDEDFLNFVVISLGVMVAESNKYRDKPSVTDLVVEVNKRFFENTIGYQYVDGQIVRVDSQFLHTEVVLPALEVLSDASYAAADAEFRGAHGHYRHARYDEAATEAGKAFESVMKVILAERSLPHDPKQPAAKLLEALRIGGVIESTWMVAVLQGAATLRNHIGGHGDGVKPVTVPIYLAHYALTTSAAAITYLVNRNKSIP